MKQSRFGGLAAGLLLAFALPASATVLFFDTPAGSYTNGGVNAAYGDNGTGSGGGFNYLIGR
jgi:hypothetical protein